MPLHLSNRSSMALKCETCGLPIIYGTYLVDHWDRSHCGGCCSESRACRFCAAPSRPTGICPKCMSLAVNDMATAQRHFLKVAAFARTLRLVVKGQSLKFELGSASAIRAKQGDDSFSDWTWGQTQSTTTILGGKQSRTVDGVTLVRGLPWPIFEGVVAHELGHVWATTHNLLFGHIEEEGICQLISHHWYRLHGTLGSDRLAEMIEADRDPVYGEGFRMMRKAQGRRPLEVYLQELLTRSLR